MKNCLLVVWIVLIMALVVPLESRSSAQSAGDDAGDSKVTKGVEKVPRAALLTKRGRELADELQLLKRNRATMGAKHPTLPTIEKKIAEIEEELEAWEPAVGDAAQNPFHPEKTPPQLNEFDLRQLVLRLNKRVEQLEKRVALLEGK